MRNTKWICMILALLLAAGILPLTAVPVFAGSNEVFTITGWDVDGPAGSVVSVKINGVTFPASGGAVTASPATYVNVTVTFADGYVWGAFRTGVTMKLVDAQTGTHVLETSPVDNMVYMPEASLLKDYPQLKLIICTEEEFDPSVPADPLTLTLPTVKCGTVLYGLGQGSQPQGCPVTMSGSTAYVLLSSAYYVKDPNSPVGYNPPQEDIVLKGGDTAYVVNVMLGPVNLTASSVTVKNGTVEEILFNESYSVYNGHTMLAVVVKATVKHDYGSWEVTKEPTPTETGMKQRVCKGCGHVQKQKLPAFGITKHPSKKTVAAGEIASFTVTAVGTDLTYQWQYSKDGGSTWKDCKSDGSDSRTFSFTATASMNGRLYRCKVADKYSEATSNSAKLTVTAGKPVITKQPAALSVTANTASQFSVTATGSNLTYQWQYSKDGGSTWTDCTSASHDKATFSFTPKVSMDDRLYRCVVSNSAGSVTSDSVRLLVAGAKPAVTTQPSAQSVKAGTTVKFSVKATGSGLKYQWQYSKDNGKTWTDCVSPNHDKATFKFVAKDSMNGRLYRCVVTNAYGKATSSTAKLTVK